MPFSAGEMDDWNNGEETRSETRKKVSVERNLRKGEGAWLRIMP